MYYRRVSYRWNASAWLDEVEPPAQPLTEHLNVDVVVVGGGFTGLSTALALREEGISVAVLESRVAGFGASGRNAGHLTPTIGKDLPTLAMLYGKARTAALVHLAETAVAYAESLIEKHDIQCDYEAVGNLFAAVHEKHFKAVDKAASAAEKFGAPGRVLEREDLLRDGMPRGFLRGFLEPSGGILNPAKYVRGLRRAALASGAELYEMSPVERIDSGPVVSVSTPRGRVSARYLVIATNGYSNDLKLGDIGLDRPNIARISVQLFRTAPLSEIDLEALDWRSRYGVYTAHEVLESYRLTADNRIVGGSKVVRYAFADSPLPSVDPCTGERLEAAFRARFPEIAHVPVTEHWGGPIAFSLDFLPQVGRAGAHRNMLYAAGYCGHGVAQASYAGRMIADLLLERDGPGSALWTRRSIGMPPEPLRWLVAKSLIRVFEALDRRVDG